MYPVMASCEVDLGFKIGVSFCISNNKAAFSNSNCGDKVITQPNDIIYVVSMLFLFLSTW